MNDDTSVPTTPTAPEARLRAVAHRLLGTFPEADEAVEDARRTWRWPEDPTVAVAAACLSRLRARETHDRPRRPPRLRVRRLRRRTSTS